MRRKKTTPGEGTELTCLPRPEYSASGKFVDDDFELIATNISTLLINISGKIPVRVVIEDESVLMDKLKIQHPQTKFQYKVRSLVFVFIACPIFISHIYR